MSTTPKWVTSKTVFSPEPLLPTCPKTGYVRCAARKKNFLKKFRPAHAQCQAVFQPEGGLFSALCRTACRGTATAKVCPSRTACTGDDECRAFFTPCSVAPHSVLHMQKRPHLSHTFHGAGCRHGLRSPGTGRHGAHQYRIAAHSINDQCGDIQPFHAGKRIHNPACQRVIVHICRITGRRKHVTGHCAYFRSPARLTHHLRKG